MKVDRYLLAVFLFGAVATTPSLAEQRGTTSAEATESNSTKDAGSESRNLDATSPAGHPGSHQNGSGPGIMDAGAKNADDDAAKQTPGLNGTEPHSTKTPRTGASTQTNLVGPVVNGSGHHQVSTPGGGTSAKESGTGVNPIDTSITVNQGRRVSKETKKHDVLKKIDLTNPLGNVRDRHQTPDPHAMGSVARNAIGVPVDSMGTKGRPRSVDGAARNAVGGITKTGPASVDSVAKNAVGSVAHNSESAGAPVIGHQSSGPPAAGIPTNNASVNGTGMIRLGSGPGIVGGPAKRTMEINRTAVRPKHN